MQRPRTGRTRRSRANGRSPRGPVERGPIWARPEPGSRRPSLSRELIAQTALGIADDEGFDAVSMRRIAEVLGVGTMTLYHYLRTKEELLALMEDAIMAEALVPDGELPEDWREALAAIARRSRDAFLRHPWSFNALRTAGMGPNSLRHVEQSMAAVANAPLDVPGKVALCGVIDDLVFGYVMRHVDGPVGENRAINGFVTDHLATGQFPHIARFVGAEKPSAAFTRAVGWMRDERRFEFALQALFDAVAAGRSPMGMKASSR